ncbi:primosome assembly protein PriA [Dermacoccaceae bacterium W4C1]
MTSSEPEPQQSLLGLDVPPPAVSSPAPQLPANSADTDPIATVLVETGLAHLDRGFEYSVPASLDAQAVPGARVKVRFAGQDVPGFIVERSAVAEHRGKLAPLRTVVSPEPVLSPELLQLAGRVAQEYAGTVGDVLRLAIPPRHARAEKALDASDKPAAEPIPATDDPAMWSHYPAGPALLRRVAEGQAPGAAWLCPLGNPAAAPDIAAADGAQPGDPYDWAASLAVLAQHALGAGRGVLLLVPDAHDVTRLSAALTARIGADQFVTLSADQGAQARWTAWLKARRGLVRCVIGTRAAAFAPVTDLGLIACWDDGDDSFIEPRAPYPHTAQVLAIRAELAGAALVLGGWTRSARAQAWVASGALHPVQAGGLPRPARVHVAGEGSDIERHGPAATAHLPSAAWSSAKRALQVGPVLVQTPRLGYLPSLTCAGCRHALRCPDCSGPLSVGERGGQPWCRTCRRTVTGGCAFCGDTRVRSSTVGAGRTAEELGRAFPGVKVIRADADHRITQVPGAPALVVATPGAEPQAQGGYCAVLLLDAWALLERPALDAHAEAFRRWNAALALVRPGDEGGVAVLAGAPAHAGIPAIEALVRADPVWFAERELAERAEAGAPPGAWVASLAGSASVLRAVLDDLQLPDAVTVLGPVPIPGAPVQESGPETGPENTPGPRSDPGRRPTQAEARVLLRVSAQDHTTADAVRRALHAMRAERSARKETGTVQVRIDPDPRLL